MAGHQEKRAPSQPLVLVMLQLQTLVLSAENVYNLSNQLYSGSYQFHLGLVAFYDLDMKCP